MSELLPVTIRLVIDPLEYIRDRLPGPFASGNDADPLRKLADALRAIPDVDEAEVGHLNYVEVTLDTEDFALAQQEFLIVQQKIKDVVDEWIEGIKADLRRQQGLEL